MKNWTSWITNLDEAFPLKKNLMRPFPGTSLTNPRIFNYRLSRARRTVENAFGIMSSRFRVFRRPLSVSPWRADCIVQACTVLRNFLRDEESYYLKKGRLIMRMRKEWFNVAIREGLFQSCGPWWEQGSVLQVVQQKCATNMLTTSRVMRVPYRGKIGCWFVTGFLCSCRYCQTWLVLLLAVCVNMQIIRRYAAWHFTEDFMLSRSFM